MIKSFAGKLTAALFQGVAGKAIAPDLALRARLKLTLIDAAANLSFPKSPPGNNLERPAGDRDGQYSIRINRQWRICFNWVDGHAENVEFCDYH